MCWFVYRLLSVLILIPKMTNAAGKIRLQHSLMTLPLVPAQNYGLQSSLGAILKKTPTSLNKAL